MSKIERAIHKLPLIIEAEFMVKMPVKFTPMSVQMQRGVPCLWYATELGDPKIDRRVYCIGTGHILPDMSLIYLGTVVIDNPESEAFPSLVWHFMMLDGPMPTTRSAIEAAQPG